MTRALLAAVLVAALAGCSVLRPPSSDAQDAAAAGPPPFEVTIDAPGPLKALLERNLDVIRLGELARGETLDETERARLAGAAPAQARALLETEGYFDAEVASARDGRQLTLTVRPGPRSRIGRVTVEVQGPLQEAADGGDAAARALLAELSDGWPLAEGEPFRNPDWEDAKAATLARLRGGGYAAATWSGTAAEVDTAARRVRIFVVADSGPLFRAGALEIRGLKHHDAETVQNLAGFKPGAPLTEARLLDFQERLRRSGLFDTASVTFRPNVERADAAPVRVRLAEAPRQAWTFGVGLTADTGPRLSVEHLHRRPFGWAAIAHNKVEWGRLHTAWNGELSTHPLPRQYRWLIGGAYDRLEGDVDVVRSERLRIGRAQNTPRMDRILFAEVERSWRRVFDTPGSALDSEELALSLNHHGVWRRLDDLLLPTRGFALSLQTGVGQARSDPGGSGPFGRLYARATGYLPLGNWYGQGRIELGQVFRRDGVGVPDSQQFRAGGDDSVRGYAYRSLGPTVDGLLDSGDALFTTSIELARPISQRLPSLWGAVFVDAGNAATRFSDLSPAVGVGAGVRWRSPVGPLRLDLAWGERTQKLRLHFSVGVAF